MGQIICVEGIDGSGKTTQTALLSRYLREAGHLVVERAYPIYGTFFGKEIGELLATKRSDRNAASLDPKSMALWYALDRWHDYEQSRAEFATADYVLFNRYTLSNMVYQSARSDDSRALAKWIHRLEREILGLPEPDAYVLLDLPPAAGLTNLSGKGDRDYLQGTSIDSYERDSTLQVRARSLYRELVGDMDHGQIIECMGGGAIKAPDVISVELITLLRKAGRIS